MKNYFFAIIVASLLVKMVSGQAKPPKPEKIETKIIRMPRYPLADFPKKTMAIAGINIIQQVRDSVRLGFVLKGMDNQVAELMLNKPLTETLQIYIEKMYGDDYKKQGAKMLWVLKELRFGEKTSMFKEYSYCRFSIDSYITTDELNYTFITKIDTVYFSSSGGDVTAWHGTEVEDAFKMLLKETLKVGPEALLVKKETKTYYQLSHQNNFLKDEILNTINYEEGAYSNFNEFLSNKPSIKNFEMVAINKKQVKCVAENKKDTLNIWGFCKQGEIYKFEENNLIPIEKFGNEFIISDYVQKTNRKNRNAFAIGMLGGIVGGAVGVGIVAGASPKTPKGVYLVKSITQLTKPKEQPEACCINMQTGNLSF